MVLSNFAQRFQNCIKAFCTSLSLKTRGSHSSEVFSRRSRLLSSMTADPCTQVTTQHSRPRLSTTILPGVFLVFKLRLYGGRILDAIIIITVIVIEIISLRELRQACFPEVVPHPSNQKVNKNKSNTVA